MPARSSLFGPRLIDGDVADDVFLKIVAAGVLAVGAGTWLAYGRLAREALRHVLSLGTAIAVMRSIALTLAVQVPMAFAYIYAGKLIVPNADVLSLTAATTIVMFGASIPISFAGWGVRELSAIATYQAIGIGPEQAFFAAAAVGMLSMASALLLGMVSAKSWFASSPAPMSQHRPRIDIVPVLGWVLPLAAATAVFFQVYVPVKGVLLNVNLADGIVIAAAAATVIGLGWRQDWRVRGLNMYVLLATSVLALGFAIGAMRFGVTGWALINRGAGWVVLLCFALTGAFVVRMHGRPGFQTLLLTFAAVGAALAFLEIVLTTARAAGFDVPAAVLSPRVAGLAQNPNAFAFQMLISIIAALCVPTSRAIKSLILGLLLVGIYMSGSIAAYITLPVVVAASIYYDPERKNDVIGGGVMGLGIALIMCAPTLLPVPVTHAYLGNAIVTNAPIAARELPILSPVGFASNSTHERIIILREAWAMFLEHPILGAGLGAFLDHTRGEGTPLIIHSTVLWLMAELGCVGLAVFAWPVVRIWRQEWPAGRTDAAARVIVLCLLAFVTMGLFHELLYQRLLWLILGAAMAVSASPQPHRWGPSAVGSVGG